MQTVFARNAAWRAEHGVPEDAPCRWDLPSATLTIERPGREPVVATVCLVGTTSHAEGTFLWSWANAAVPPQHGQALEQVREFGLANGLGLLTTPLIQGGKPEATECLCIAAHLQRATGTVIDQQDDVGLYFTILHIHRTAPAASTAPAQGTCPPTEQE